MIPAPDGKLRLVNTDEHGPGEQSHQLAQTMADVAARLHAEPDRQRTMATILHAATTTVPGAELAGVSLIKNDEEITALELTDERVQRLDELQNELGEGPCLRALRAEHTVRVDDLATDTRWPRYGPRAVELGVRSVLSFELFARGTELGALNMYSSKPHAFGENAYVVGHLFAQHAAVAYAEASEEHHLNEALTNRDLIGQAKGILMYRDRLTATDAFELLAQASQQANIKLVEVARWLITETQKRPNTGSQ